MLIGACHCIGLPPPQLPPPLKLLRLKLSLNPLLRRMLRLCMGGSGRSSGHTSSPSPAHKGDKTMAGLAAA